MSSLPLRPRPLTIVYTNLQAGLNRGADLHLLPEILRPTTEDGHAPGLVGICEARWWHNGGDAAEEVARRLADIYSAPYRLLIGGINRSDTPPALAVRTDLFTVHRWATPANEHDLYSRNTALLAWSDDAQRVALRVHVAHWDHASRVQRSIEADAAARQFNPALTNIFMADTNSALSGLQGGDRDWTAVPAHKRREKARLVKIDGVWTWVKDTPTDALIGPWDDSEQRRRSDLGAGYFSLAEAHWEQQGRPARGLEPTTNTDQALPIDHILADNTVELLSDSHRVHLNTHSDHGVVHARVLIHPRKVTAR